MAHLVDRFNTIALIERFNHLARQRGCDYAGIETNRAFMVLFISILEGGQHVISLMMGGIGPAGPSFTVLYLFHTGDLYGINDRVRLSLTVRLTNNGTRYLELGIVFFFFGLKRGALSSPYPSRI